MADGANGGKALRWKDMGSLRKLAVIEGILGIEHWDALVYEPASPVVDRHHKDAMVRVRILRVALPDLSCKQGIAHITLETRSQPSQGFISHDRRDHEVLRSLLDKGEIHPDFRIDHSGKSEPMLWLAATGGLFDAMFILGFFILGAAIVVQALYRGPPSLRLVSDWALWPVHATRGYRVRAPARPR